MWNLSEGHAANNHSRARCGLIEINFADWKKLAARWHAKTRFSPPASTTWCRRNFKEPWFYGVRCGFD